jgi:hypothetical protein
MASASTDNTTNSISNDLLKHNSSDMAHKALNSSHDQIPMNLLPAGN